jgi:hypothetical protein
MVFKLILAPNLVQFVHVVFIQAKDKFPRHIGLVVLISRSPQSSKIINCTTGRPISQESSTIETDRVQSLGKY